MRFKGFDLNLLVALEALLSEQSVSRAAQRLNLTQPAASAALSRLRNHFDDEILVPDGKAMIPTAHAKSIAPALREVLVAVEQLLAISTTFDPRVSQRRFRVTASDYMSTVLITPLLPRIEREAPGVTFDITMAGQGVPMLERGEMDLILSPEEYISKNHPAELLFEERHVVVGWSGNPVFDKPMSEDAFFGAGHVAVELRAGGKIYFEEQFARIGRSRRVEVMAASFLGAPFMIPNTMRLTVMHERLARMLVTHLPLRLAPLPFDFPTMRMMAQYHRTRRLDAGLQWLVGRVREQAAATTLPPLNPTQARQGRRAAATI